MGRYLYYSLFQEGKARQDKQVQDWLVGKISVSSKVLGLSPGVLYLAGPGMIREEEQSVRAREEVDRGSKGSEQVGLHMKDMLSEKVAGYL